MPAGRLLRTSVSLAFSWRVTSWLFSPMSMKPSPSTTSPLPSAVTAPRRISRPSTTRATSRTWVDPPVDLPLVTAPGVDFGYAAHRAHLRLDDPVVDGPQLAERPASPRHQVVEDLPQARRDRPQLRALDPGG